MIVAAPAELLRLVKMVSSEALVKEQLVYVTAVRVPETAVYASEPMPENAVP